MVIVIKCFKGATYVDRFNNMYRAKTTFVIRQTPFRESYYLTNGKLTSKSYLSRAHQVKLLPVVYIGRMR